RATSSSCHSEDPMKASALRFLVCPACREALELRARAEEGREVMTGSLVSPRCGREYPIVRGIPRFVDSQGYAASFGYEWNRFSRVQLDSVNGTRQSQQALEATTGWKDSDYQGRLVLDAGVGSGRFAEVVASKGGEVVGIDLTTAVEAAWDNIGRHERVHLLQADIFAMPF